MGPVVSVNPFRCRVWKLHDRLEENITEQSCKAEIASFSAHGQLVPALGRRITNDPGHDVELVYGARRLFVARHLNIPLQVELRELSDRDAIVAMDVENRQRQDISPYERAMSYARWLRSGYFKSQVDIAGALQISVSQVSRLLKLAKLPSVVVGAFNDPSDICEGWGTELADALSDAARRNSIIETARSISASRTHISSQEIYRRLISAGAPGRKPKTRCHDKVVTDSSGEAVFRVQYRRNAIALLLPTRRISGRLLEAIEGAVVDVLQEHQIRNDAVRTIRAVRIASVDAVVAGDARTP